MRSSSLSSEDVQRRVRERGDRGNPPRGRRQRSRSASSTFYKSEDSGIRFSSEERSLGKKRGARKWSGGRASHRRNSNTRREWYVKGGLVFENRVARYGRRAVVGRAPERGPYLIIEEAGAGREDRGSGSDRWEEIVRDDQRTLEISWPRVSWVGTERLERTRIGGLARLQLREASEEEGEIELPEVVVRRRVRSYCDVRLALWCDLHTQSFAQWMRIGLLKGKGRSASFYPPCVRSPIIGSAEFLTSQAFSVFNGLSEMHCYCRGFHVISQFSVDGAHSPLRWISDGPLEGRSAGYVKVGVCPFQWAVGARLFGRFIRVWVPVRYPTISFPSIDVVIAALENKKQVIMFKIGDEYGDFVGLVAFSHERSEAPKGWGWRSTKERSVVRAREETPRIGYINLRASNAHEWRQAYDRVGNDGYRAWVDRASDMDGLPSWLEQRRSEPRGVSSDKAAREVFADGGINMLPAYPQWLPVVVASSDWIDEGLDIAPAPRDAEVQLRLWEGAMHFLRRNGRQVMERCPPASQYVQIRYPALSRWMRCDWTTVRPCTGPEMIRDPTVLSWEGLEGYPNFLLGGQTTWRWKEFAFYDGQVEGRRVRRPQPPQLVKGPTVEEVVRSLIFSVEGSWEFVASDRPIAWREGSKERVGYLYRAEKALRRTPSGRFALNLQQVWDSWRSFPDAPHHGFARHRAELFDFTTEELQLAAAAEVSRAFVRDEWRWSEDKRRFIAAGEGRSPARQQWSQRGYEVETIPRQEQESSRRRPFLSRCSHAGVREDRGNTVGRGESRGMDPRRRSEGSPDRAREPWGARQGASGRPLGPVREERVLEEASAPGRPGNDAAPGMARLGRTSGGAARWSEWC